jgi:8-oxo-dGTP pyrophosphatase MutT (NUDIX family)
MSVLFDRLSAAFTASLDRAHLGLHNDGQFVPPVTRPAAVLMAVTDRPEPGLILTHRPHTMAKHPGQVSFPGGKVEPGEDAVAAALREAEEELAIAPAAVRVVGEAQTFSTGSGFEVTPVLGVIAPDTPITPDPREVAAWFEVPLAFALDRANHVPRVGLLGGHERRYVEIMYGEHRIWGITAAIIGNLSHRLEGELFA